MKTAFTRLAILICLVVLSWTSIASAIIMSPEQKTIIRENINYYDLVTCGSPSEEATGTDASADDSSAGTGSTASSVDISDIVKKYDLQSVMIQEVGGDVIASYNPNQAPITPASTMKLIIADTALRSGLDLNKRVAVTSDLYYSGKNDLGKSSVTLGEALDAMLSQSSNVGANVLMKALGGVKAFTKKAQGYGYTHTSVRGYYDPSNDGENSSTIGDQVTAMNHIFSSQGTDYERAQNDLKTAASSDNFYSVDDVANKWAGTSQVAGNVGLFEINGNQYVIGLYYNGSADDPTSKTAIKSGSADLASALENSAADSSSSSTSDICCPPSDTGSGTITLDGKDNVDNTVMYFMKQGLTAAQAVGIAANFMWETGGGVTIDPLIAGPTPSGTAWGIAQWTPPSTYIQDKQKAGITGDDGELLTQLEVVWAELQGKGAVYTTNLLPGLQKITNAGEAATYFSTQFERCDPSNASCTTDRVNTANDLIKKYADASAPSGTTSTGTSSGSCSSGSSSGSSESPGTVAAAVAAAKQLSDMKVGYVWGGLHGPGQLDITEPSKLRAIGADCSGSVSWVLHQAGMFPGDAGIVSGDFGSWGESGEGKEMTVWENSGHVFIEFNVPGLGHYQLNTVAPGSAPSTTPGATGSGPRFYKWGPPGGVTSGFTPRHWKDT